MVSVLRKILHGKKEGDLDFAGMRAQADIEAGMANAKRAGIDTFAPPVPSHGIKMACLERWYYFVRTGSPDLKLSADDLSSLEPSGLSDRELREWYWGLRCEAARRILFIANTSYSKSAVRETMNKEGLENGIVLLDPGTRESYEDVVKFLSD